MQDEWSDEIALEGHTAGLAALTRDGLPTAEAFTSYLADHDALLFPSGEDEIDIADVMRRAFAAQGADLQDDELWLFIRAAHDVWASHYSLAASSHALLEALRARGLRLDEPELARCALDGTLDAQHVLGRVEIGPAQPQQFAAA